MADLHGLISQMAAELDHCQQLLRDDRRQRHPLADHARTLLAEPEAEGPSELELETIERQLWDKYRRTNARGGNGLMYDVDFSYALEEYRAAAAPVAIPGERYHEDMGPVTWWRLPVDEPPWVGTPNDSDWPGYHTHFTPAPTNPLNAHALPLPTPEAAND
jgi:hypothetical protein